MLLWLLLLLLLQLLCGSCRRCRCCHRCRCCTHQITETIWFGDRYFDRLMPSLLFIVDRWHHRRLGRDATGLQADRGRAPMGGGGADRGRCGPHVAMDRDGDRSSGSLVICFPFASFVPMHFRCFSRMREETHTVESEEVTMSAPTLLQLTRKSIFLTWFGIQKQLSIGDH